MTKPRPERTRSEASWRGGESTWEKPDLAHSLIGLTWGAIGTNPEAVGCKARSRYNATVSAPLIELCYPVPAKAVPVGDGWLH